MADIDVRLETGELSPKLVLHTERSYGPVLDIELAPHVTVNGSPDAFREFFREGLDLIDMVCPPARNVLDDIPPHDGDAADVADRCVQTLIRTGASDEIIAGAERIRDELRGSVG